MRVLVENIREASSKMLILKLHVETNKSPECLKIKELTSAIFVTTIFS